MANISVQNNNDVEAKQEQTTSTERDRPRCFYESDDTDSENELITHITNDSELTDISDSDSESESDSENDKPFLQLKLIKSKRGFTFNLCFNTGRN